MNEPDSPGNNIPVTPIIPHINIYTKLVLSEEGESKAKETAIAVPIIKKT